MARVLVVDDDPDILEVIELVLSSRGYEVVTARNGAHALDLLRTGLVPDVILLDLMMPVMSGWEFRAEQQRVARWAAIPVIALSGDQRASVEDPGMGGVQWLAKPVTLVQLLTMVERTCSGAAQGPEATPPAGP